MPVLARAKYRLGREIGSRSLMADSRETLACAWLSVALLVGLLANWLLHWWWADPVAGLAVVWFLGREGLEALRGEECGCGDACEEPAEEADENAPAGRTEE